MATEMMDAMIASFRQSMTDVSPDFWTAVRARMQSKELIDLLVPVYQRNLSDDDLEGLIQFYSSAAGKRYVEKQPVIFQESIQAGQEWGRRVMEQALADLDAKGKAALPAPANPVAGTSSAAKARKLLEAMASDRAPAVITAGCAAWRTRRRPRARNRARRRRTTT